MSHDFLPSRRRLVEMAGIGIAAAILPAAEADARTASQMAQHTEREGQKLVPGKIRLLPSGSGDLFLVLATKVY